MMLTILAIAAAAPSATAPEPRKPMSTQARFDAANEAATAGRCAEAVSLYEALEQAPAILRNPLARAMIAVRKGGCMIATGRAADGETSIRSGLPTLEGKGAEFAPDVRDARIALSRASGSRFDYDTAIAQADKALTMSAGYARVVPLMMLSVLTMFDGDGRAVAYTEEARRVIGTETDASKREVAAVQTQSARALLNAGRTKEAYLLLKNSLAKQGGLNLKVTLLDVATRSDLAIAALLTGDKEGARQYLAYTGAGRISQAPFTRAESMDAPSCDPAIGLKPSDVAVVEFSIDEEGRVMSVQPIYVTGNRAAATAFARAVTGWSWKAADAKAVPIFYRTLTRVELRCSTGADVSDEQTQLADSAKAWLFEDAAPAWDGMSDAAAVRPQRAALASARPGSRAELLALFALASNVSLDTDERRGFAARGAAIAPPLNPPASVRAWLALRQIPDDFPKAKRQAALRGLLADPVIGGDPLAGAALRLAIAAPYEKPAIPSDAMVLLDQVIATPGLPDHHPLKVNALLRRANLLAATGDLAGADAAFRQTGLSAEQCAMLGVTPALRKTGASADDFPMEAQRWGFEGWVRTEFDISADGRTAQQRALIAYPPFVFDDAATGIARQSRWTSSYRPGGSLACAASQMSVRFLIP